ncbi:MAG: SAM-dependent DNA methyltransferase [Candidatus Binatia bacterium]
MKTRTQTQFGDFQTPVDLAQQVIQFLSASGVSPSVVIEPTCGLGNFLIASIGTFGGNIKHYGFDINPNYINRAKDALARLKGVRYELQCENFYDKDWTAFFRSLPEGLLIIGNPPWVTNATLGSMRSGNLPEKSNFQGHRGFAAKTGKANFDISEWMLIRLLESLNGMQATLAMLCKTATARKILRHAWNHKFEVWDSSLHLIDAKQHFGVSVDACLFVTHTGKKEQRQTASVYVDFSFTNLVARFGIYHGELVADIDAFRSFEDIDGIEYRKWRSGVKHDAAKIMELKPDGNFWVNGLGERCTLESTYLFPLLKSSDLANDRLQPSKYVLLTQRKVTDDTSSIGLSAPKTWQYLLTHCDYLDRRRSSIYSKRPRFAVFGVGPYTFSPWKVAISGLYRNPVFRVIGSVNGKPIVLDDTCYFIPCETEEEATFFCLLLNSEIAKTFIRSLVFFDAKRPITIDVLKRIDLKKIAERMNSEKEATHYLTNAVFEKGQQQLLIFEDEGEYRTNGCT